jgi:hypothetical protein
MPLSGGALFPWLSNIASEQLSLQDLAQRPGRKFSSGMAAVGPPATFENLNSWKNT